MKTLIISDIHANIPVLNAVLNKEANYDKLIFLGDVNAEKIDVEVKNIFVEYILFGHTHVQYKKKD